MSQKDPAEESENEIEEIKSGEEAEKSEEESDSSSDDSKKKAGDVFNAPAAGDGGEVPLVNVNQKELRKWMEPGLHGVHVLNLRWDTKQEWGQIRMLDEDRVRSLMREVLDAPPRVPIRVLLRRCGQGICVFTPFRRYIPMFPQMMCMQ